MFERYTQTARRVIISANYIARQVGSRDIDTEHLLLGILSTDQRLARRFLGSPWAADEVWKIVEFRKPPTDEIIGAGEIPLSRAASEALKAAVNEADRFSRRNIDTAHLLLGLLEAEGLAAEIMHERGIHLSEARQQLNAEPHDDSIYERFVRNAVSRPADITELENRIRSIRDRLEEAVGSRDFAAARKYSDEERFERDRLNSLYRKYGLADWIYFLD